MACHTVVIDPGPNQTYKHYMGDGPAEHDDATFTDETLDDPNSMESGAPSFGFLPSLTTPVFFTTWYCEDCHTTQQQYTCTQAHTQCGSPDDAALIDRAVAAAIAGRESELRAMLKTSKRLTINTARAALQILDCKLDHVIGHVPLAAGL
jgi:hypothetical protein